MFLELVCAMPGVKCYDLMASLTGPNCCLSDSIVDMYLKYELQPTSVRTLVHFSDIQTWSDNEIRPREQYGQHGCVWAEQPTRVPYVQHSTPPAAAALLRLRGHLSDVKDVHLLLNDLSNHDADKLVAQLVKDYAHLDFVMGVNAELVVYDGLIAFFDKHS
ncbi:triacylglycerol lipase 2-like [Musa acuminata AAA Group]|uniref:triacylglycerol lipase 2-like n=1 Tax=Musa acuminata AAA Group TaxID=214697 RepID=UPI0031E2DCA0